ncbi:hypothetical protein BpHYR1_050375 [Brachionus plicatilis]|uniref:Uncharacterized protein n=1 Tax=Brachionus plicatilis TaxID=10195 RepID=A0A3M7SV01_BRAPC|nr:hypothetical protein BpHYR1_050375 [Brachionus plicatilis]
MALIKRLRRSPFELQKFTLDNVSFYKDINTKIAYEMENFQNSKLTNCYFILKGLIKFHFNLPGSFSNYI